MADYGFGLFPPPPQFHEADLEMHELPFNEDEELLPRPQAVARTQAQRSVAAARQRAHSCAQRAVRCCIRSSEAARHMAGAAPSAAGKLARWLQGNTLVTLGVDVRKTRLTERSSVQEMRYWCRDTWKHIRDYWLGDRLPALPPRYGVLWPFSPPEFTEGARSLPVAGWWGQGHLLWPRFITVLVLLALVAYSKGAAAAALVALVASAIPYRAIAHEVYPLVTTSALSAGIRKIVLFEPKTIRSAHNHPKLAAARNAANTSIDTFIFRAGYNVYSIQMSHTDIVDGKIQGSLKWIWDCDAHSPERSDPLTTSHVIKMVNVDYYVDWHDYLWVGLPFMLYTMTPQVPCGSFHEAKWTVRPDNKLDVAISGGGTYVHELWDYNIDHCTAFYPGVAIVYSVETVVVDELWSIVLLHPKQAYYSRGRTGTTLKRRQLFHRVKTMDGSTQPSALIQQPATTALIEPRLAVGVPGEYSSVVLPAAVQTILTARARVKTVAYADLTQLLVRDFGEDSRLAQAVIYQAFPVTTPAVSESMAVRKKEHDDWAITYRKAEVPRPALVTTDVPTMRALCPPVIPGGCGPAASRAMDEMCIKERLTDLKNPRTRLSPQCVVYANEFICMLLPTPGTLHPITVNQVYERQTRMSQRLANERAMPQLSSWLVAGPIQVSSFQKAEATSCGKPPRNITTLPAEHCLLYSTYTLALADHLKTTEWYAFGLHPDDVARRVHRLASRATTLVPTDFSKFDGTHSEALYAFELAVFLRAFPTSEHHIIRNVHSAMVGAESKTRHGVRYNTGGSRLSGAADTSLGNSLDNAYVAYCALRAQGLSPKEAWKALGIYGGDDGITADVDVVIYDNTAAGLGLKLKAVSQPAHAEIGFLGRIYPNPKGHAGHMADLPRQLTKLHVQAGREDIDPKIKLQHKAMGHAFADTRTPVLGAWCAMIKRLYGQVAFNADQLSYSARAYLFNASSGGSVDVCDETEMYETATRALGVSVDEIKRYEAHMAEITDIKDLRPLRDAMVVVPPGIIMGNIAGQAPRPPVVPTAPMAIEPVIRGEEFMITKPADHVQLVEFIAAHMPAEAKTLCDGTAFRGNDTVAIAKRLPDIDVVAVEADTQHALDATDYLIAQAKRIGRTEMFGFVRRARIEQHMEKHTYDMLYLDPPWVGGRAYRTVASQVPRLGQPLPQLLASLLTRKRIKTVVCKLPTTYDTAAHHAALPAPEFESQWHTVTREGRPRFLLVAVRRKDDPPPAPCDSKRAADTPNGGAVFQREKDALAMAGSVAGPPPVAPPVRPDRKPAKKGRVKGAPKRSPAVPKRN